AQPESLARRVAISYTGNNRIAGPGQAGGIGLVGLFDRFRLGGGCNCPRRTGLVSFWQHRRGPSPGRFQPLLTNPIPSIPKVSKAGEMRYSAASGDRTHV